MTDWNAIFGGSGGSSGGGGTNWDSIFGGGSKGAAPKKSSGGLFDEVGGLISRGASHIPGEHYVASGLHDLSYIGGNAATQGGEVIHALPSAIPNIAHLLSYSLNHQYGRGHGFAQVADEWLHPIRNLQAGWNDPKNLLDQWVHQPANDVSDLFSAKGRHRLAQHPLNLPLDVLAAADPVGRVASKAARAGTLGARAEELATAPRILTDSGGEYSRALRKAPTLHGMALQRMFDKFSTAHPELHYFGNDARLAKMAGDKSYYRTQSEVAIARQFQKAGKPLTNPERFAFHIAAEPLGLQQRIDLFSKLNEIHPSAGLRKYVSMLKDPAVADVLKNPRPEFSQAVDAGRQLEAKAGETMTKAGKLTPEIRSERVQLPAKTFEETMGFKPGARPDIHENLGEPFRFPHVGTTKNPSVFSTPLGPLKGIKSPGFLKKNRAALLTKAQIITDPVGVYSQDFMRTQQWLHKLDLQEHVYDKVARDLSPDLAKLGGKPENGAYYWSQKAQEEAKAKGLTDRKIPRDVKNAPELQQDRAILDTVEHGKSIQEAADRTMFDALPADLEGKTVAELTKLGVKWVPAKWADAYKKEFQRTSAMARLVFDKPTDWWRALTLKYRPAWAVNNIVGQNLLYALNATPGSASAYASALKMRQEGHDLSGIPGAQQGFARTQSHITRSGFAQPIVDRSAVLRTARAIGKPAGWLLKPIQAVGQASLYLNELGEQIPRDAAVIKALKDQGIDVRALQKAGKSVGDAHNAWVDAVKAGNQTAVEHAVEEVNTMLGDFGRMSHVERTVIRRIVPFYSWFKTITIVTGKYILRNPLRVKVLQQMSQFQQENDANLPSWLKGAIPLGSSSKGFQTMLSTVGVNPFETLNQLGPTGGSLVHGKTQFGSANPGGLLNPFIGAAITAITGKDTFTGGDYYGPGANQGAIGRGLGDVLSGLPEYQLAEKAAGKSYPSKLYSQDKYHGLPPYLWNYLGLPIRRVNVKKAKAEAKAGQ